MNINSLRSINKLYDKDRCIKELLRFIKTHKLKFLCIQDLLYKDASMFNKIINTEGLYCSLGDFERQYFKDTDLCNVVISTSNIIILNNKLLPGGKQHFITFKHPNYTKVIFLNTKLIESDSNSNLKLEQLTRITETNSNYIFGSLYICKGAPLYTFLKSSNYALNNTEIYGTTIGNTQVDYILSKLPNILSSTITINYRYSDHKAIIGKI